MTKCRLYAWGANSHGQLGLGYESEQSTLPHEVDLSSIDLDPRCIKKIFGGGGHTLILDKQGRVYSCGWNNKAQTGILETFPRSILHFQRINRFDGEFINEIACGWDCSMAITENGKLFVWGSNEYGQLGFRTDDDYPEYYRVRPTIIKGVEKISMGLRHSALIAYNMNICVTGSGRKFQLGTEETAVKKIEAFTLVRGLDRMKDIACGQYHTLALRKSGELYAWGDNKYGQLGIDNKISTKAERYKQINFDYMGEIKQLQVGWSHSCVLNTDGNIFSWGRNTYGQLGNRIDQEENDENWKPQYIDMDSKISQLAVGSEHNVALTEDGKVITWGWNEHGNCGNGSTRNVLVPTELKVSRGTKAILVGSGAAHSFAVFEDDT